MRIELKIGFTISALIFISIMILSALANPTELEFQLSPIGYTAKNHWFVLWLLLAAVTSITIGVVAAIFAWLINQIIKK